MPSANHGPRQLQGCVLTRIYNLVSVFTEILISFFFVLSSLRRGENWPVEILGFNKEMILVKDAVLRSSRK